MIVPSTYAVALLLAIVSMICWGSWANTQKAAGKWRFELYYIDFAIGALLTALIAAFTFGSFGNDLSFQDNLLITGKTQMAYCFAGGVIFNLANMLLTAAVAVAGMAVAFPIAMGLALVISVLISFIDPQGNPLLAIGGAVFVLAAVVVQALAFSGIAATRQPKQDQASRRRQGSPSAQGILLSCVSGLLMGLFYPLVAMSRRGDLGLGSYSVAVIFAVGIFCSTFPLNLYFLNLPVQGPALNFAYYFRGTGGQHLNGLLGGILWCLGGILAMTAEATPVKVSPGPVIFFALGQGATLLAALWGLLYWKEFEGANARTKTMVVVMFLLFSVGLALISVARLV